MQERGLLGELLMCEGPDDPACSLTFWVFVVSWMYYEQPVFFYSENVMICLHKASYFSCTHDIVPAQLVWSSIITCHAEMFEVPFVCVRELSGVMHWMCCLFGYLWPALHWATKHFKMPKEKGKVFFLHFCAFFQCFFARSGFFPRGSLLRCCVHAILPGAVYT